MLLAEGFLFSSSGWAVQNRFYGQHAHDQNLRHPFAHPMLPRDRSGLIHFIGIGGDGMSSLAGLLVEAGFKIVGTQEPGGNVKQPTIIRDLEILGARIFLGHSAKYVLSGTSIVVRSSAVSDDHEEIVTARERGIPIAKRAAVLGDLMTRFQRCVAVAGTAGKTTTSAMLSYILIKRNIDVGFSIGSPLQEIYRKNYRIGAEDIFVAEADEYDRSFLSLPYRLAIVTELLFGDHPDYYADHDDLMSSFSAFVSRIPEDGKLIGYGDNAHIRTLSKIVGSRFLSYGFGDRSDFHICDCQFKPSGSQFTIGDRRGNRHVSVELQLVGQQNVANATAAIVAASLLGIPLEEAARAVRSFPGTARRFELVGISQSGSIIYDDYAHNPQQIAATMAAVRQKYPAHRIVCVFEPRQYLRTKLMLEGYAEAFAAAHQVVVLDISEGLGDLPAQREMVHSSNLVESLVRQGVDAIYGGSRHNSIQFIKPIVQVGNLLVTMGTGRLTEFARSLLAL